MNKSNKLFLSLLALAISFAVSSCTKDSDGNGSASTLANIMVVNATPGSVGYDFYIDDVLQNSSAIAYNGSSAYIQTAVGMKSLRLNNPNSAVNIVDRDDDLELNGNYTLISMDTAGNVESALISDDLTEPVLGKSHIRVVHASHNSPAVDVINLADTSVVFNNLGYRDVAAFTPVDAGSYALGYRIVGDSNITSLSTPVSVANQGIYTIVLSGYNSDSSGTPVSSLNVQLIDNVQ